MNRDHVAAELPPALTAWLHEAPVELWDAIARETAVRVAVTLATDEGAAAWDPTVHDELLRHGSPAVRAIAAGLPLGRKWSAHLVATATAQYFELWSATKHIYESVKARLGKVAPPLPE